MSETWYQACPVKEVPLDDVIGVTIQGKSYAVYRLKDGIYATDGLCTHEQACLADGFVQNGVVECPKHNARFEIATGRVLKRPAKTDLGVYQTKVDDNHVWILLKQEL